MWFFQELVLPMKTVLLLSIVSGCLTKKILPIFHEIELGHMVTLTVSELQM
jgi:hypothetical protein